MAKTKEIPWQEKEEEEEKAKKIWTTKKATKKTPKTKTYVFYGSAFDCVVLDTCV